MSIRWRGTAAPPGRGGLAPPTAMAPQTRGADRALPVPRAWQAGGAPALMIPPAGRRPSAAASAGAAAVLPAAVGPARAMFGSRLSGAATAVSGRGACGRAVTELLHQCP